MTDHIRGSLEAPIVLIEYGDYQCIYCKAAQPLLLKLRRNYGKRMAFIFRQFPLTQSHPKAFAMACAAEAVPQRKFWRMHEALFRSAGVAEASRKAGADVKVMNAVLRSRAPREKVEADIQSGIHAGVNGTPTFFINGKRYDGEHEFHAMNEYIESVMKRKRKK